MMTTEEKAQAYDEAIERAKEMIKAMINIGGVAKVDDIQYLFPELKENVDEKTRKCLLYHFSRYQQDEVFLNNIKMGDIVAWLEKQGESTDKIEPKFKVSDWIVHNNSGCICQVNEIKDDKYCLWLLDSETLWYLRIVDIDDDYRLWTIQDAKDGDVLAVEPPIDENYQYPFVAIYKERGLDFFNSYCFIGFDGKFYEGEDGHSIEDIHPATKEQRDILEKAMSDAGFTFDFENKELKKIEQKLAWSEEDEKKRKRIMHRLSLDGTINNKDLADINDWLKSLKNRVLPQPKQEWSEEDDKIKKGLINSLVRISANTRTDSTSVNYTFQKEIEWLKSLRPQSHWRPTEEQMEAIKYAKKRLPDTEVGNYKEGVLDELYEQLKVLLSWQK